MATAAESSRIFVKNLPPKLSDDEFHKHFSRGKEVTDTRFFPARRIGYVGYKSPEEARAAVKYFNKSFIRMSKIAVEIANPYTDRRSNHVQTQPEEWKETENLLKRKREEAEGQKDEESKEKQPKLDEFVKVMSQPNRTKTWQNEVVDDDTIPSKPLIKEMAEDDELQVIGGETGKRRKPSVEDDVDTEQTELDSSAIIGVNKVPAQNQDDDAWLRSRTTKLLDVESDDEDMKEDDAVTNDDNENEDETTKISSPVTIPISKPLIDPDPTKVDSTETNTQEAQKLTPEDQIRQSGRLYVRNLPFKVTEDELRQYFEQFGALEEVHTPMDTVRGHSKGFAFLLYADPEDAIKAYTEMDRKIFQGRLVHIIPAAEKKDNKLDEYAISQLPLKQQQKLKRKMESATATHKWNPLYMNMDDVMSSVASRLGVAKSDLVDATSSDAAVKQALAETHMIQEIKSYFVDNGVDLDSFKPGRQRGDTTILIKNFPYGTTPDEIRSIFEPHGQITRFLMPPSGTMALVEFALPTQGRAAFATLKYHRIKDSILFLEKAPKDVFSSSAQGIIIPQLKEAGGMKLNATDLLQELPSVEQMETSTLFVRNLNFTTTSSKLKETFAPLSGFVSAKLKTKPNPKHAGEILSMGFGFVEFKSKEDAQTALATMAGYVLEGHKLEVRPSQKVLDAGVERKNDEKAKALAAQKTKVVVKNLPFEISKKEIRALLGTYGQLRSVRIPKKFDSSSRGFAFAEFTTPREAANAMSALKNSHLLGRRLHIEYASEDVLDAEEEIERMQKKTGAQVDKVALKQLTTSTRQKFDVGGEEDQG